MGLNKFGPVTGGKKPLTREQLQKENEALRVKVSGGDSAEKGGG